MLRYRSMVVLSLVCALIGAAGLGVGLLGALPVVNTILGDRTGLPDLAQQLNDSPVPIEIPQSMIDQLPTGPFTAIVVIVIGLGVIAIIGGFANFLQAWLAIRVVQRTIAGVRRELFHRVLRLPLRVAVAEGSSDAISRIVNDTTQLAGGMTALLSKAVAQILKGFGAFVAALLLDWRLTLVSVIGAPIVAVVIRAIATRVRKASRMALESQSDLYGSASEAMRGLRVVKVHTAERYEGGRFHRINKEVMRQTIRARTLRAMSSPISEVLGLFALGGLVLLAAKLVLDGLLDPAIFLTTLAALGITAATLKPLTGIINEIQASAAAAERIADLLGAQTEPGHDAKLPKLARHSESVVFENLSFTYPGAEVPALAGITLRIEHGQTVAIVGPNGSGKTTLLSFVPRLFDPDSGRVLIDDHDVTKYSVRSLRRQIGVVTQETVIFHTSIRENIAYGATEVTEDRIISAATRARAMDFIAELPKGLDTVVGEQGATLSGGQRQRLAIARAILRDPAILILDEATSMIDADSEARIAEALGEFTADRTCLIVAHRLSTVLGADRIVVMDAGRVVDQGSHDELLARCSVYQQIAQHQLVAMT